MVCPEPAENSSGRGDQGQAGYHTWLHWAVTPRCNLRCEYCFSSAQPHKDPRSRGPTRRIDIDRLMGVLTDAGRVFRVHFTGGGEPMLVPNIVEACEALSRRHFVSFNTNLTGRIPELLEAVSPDRICGVHASLHLPELRRLGILDRWVANYSLLRDAGVSIYAEGVAYPPLLSELARDRVVLAAKGIEMKLSAYQGVWQGKTYPDAYTVDERDSIGRTPAAGTGTGFVPRGKECNAGVNFAFVDEDGDAVGCPPMPYRLGNVYSGLQFHDAMVVCPYETCPCPIREFDPDLLAQVADSDIEPRRPSRTAGKFRRLARSIHRRLPSRGQGTEGA